MGAQGWPSPLATKGQVDLYRGAVGVAWSDPVAYAKEDWTPKAWIQTYTGRQFWPGEPRVEDVNIVDIAHALSMQCRYSGHCKHFYSVAEHSVHVSFSLPTEHRLWGLLHDASEAYLTDVPRPIKPLLRGYADLEANIMAVICERYELPFNEPAEVKRVDTAILADEMVQLMAEPPAPWHLPEPPLGIQVQGWSPERAKAEFLRRFYNLTERHRGEITAP